ncbi:hypothetical protein D0T49_08270 [Paludibacter sp. 221]|nr:hypothetical protein [Paludibacter sp. 221]
MLSVGASMKLVFVPFASRQKEVDDLNKNIKYQQNTGCYSVFCHVLNKTTEDFSKAEKTQISQIDTDLGKYLY